MTFKHYWNKGVLHSTTFLADSPAKIASLTVYVTEQITNFISESATTSITVVSKPVEK